MVRSPYDKSIAEIENLLKDKVKWISRKQIEHKERAQKIEILKPTFHNNSTIPYLGKNVKLNIIQSESLESDEIELNTEELFVFIKCDDKFDENDRMLTVHVKSLYEKWIAKKSNDIFTHKVLEFSKIIKVNPNKIIIKNLRNRWGSATKKGIINLNLNLIKAPEDVVDYIIIHELCHFKIKKHSHQFWNLLRKYVPDYKRKIEWLEINGKHLIN